MTKQNTSLIKYAEKIFFVFFKMNFSKITAKKWPCLKVCYTLVLTVFKKLIYKFWTAYVP